MATTVVKADSSDFYVLENAEVDMESKRLNSQHAFIKVGLGRSSPVPPEVDLSSIKTILDVAAGTCVWLLDVIRQPEIRERIGASDTAAGAVELYATDISLAKFPPAKVTEAYGIKTFQHDVTKPFPEDMHGKFDLIHMSALVGALSSHRWSTAMQNLRAALRPGGYLLLVDYNLGLYPAKQSMPPPTWKLEDNEVLKCDPSYFLSIYSRNHVLGSATSAASLGMVFDLAHSLPRFVAEASMEVITKTPIIFPLGQRKLKGAIPPELVVGFDENILTILKNGYKYVLKTTGTNTINPLTGKDFVVEDVDAYIEWLHECLKKEGAYSCFIEVLARRPNVA